MRRVSFRAEAELGSCSEVDRVRVEGRKRVLIERITGGEALHFGDQRLIRQAVGRADPDVGAGLPSLRRDEVRSRRARMDAHGQHLLSTPRTCAVRCSTPMRIVPPVVLANATTVRRTRSGEDRSRLSSRSLPSGLRSISTRLITRKPTLKQRSSPRFRAACRAGRRSLPRGRCGPSGASGQPKAVVHLDSLQHLAHSTHSTAACAWSMLPGAEHDGGDAGRAELGGVGAVGLAVDGRRTGDRAHGHHGTGDDSRRRPGSPSVRMDKPS